MTLALALGSAMTDFGQDNKNLNLDSNRVPPEQVLALLPLDRCAVGFVSAGVGVRIVTHSATATLVVHFRIVSYKLICFLTPILDNVSPSTTKM